jgi:hypothetical protein
MQFNTGYVEEVDVSIGGMGYVEMSTPIIQEEVIVEYPQVDVVVPGL